MRASNGFSHCGAAVASQHADVRRSAVPLNCLP
jgi:hypothetical protein